MKQRTSNRADLTTFELMPGLKVVTRPENVEALRQSITRSGRIRRELTRARGLLVPAVTNRGSK